MTAFLLTWKKNVWPADRLAEMIARYHSDGHADQMWRVAAHKQAKPGDRAYLFEQGRRGRGIFGIGVLLEAPIYRPDPDGLAEPWWRAMIRFDVLSNPLKGTYLIPIGELEAALDPKIFNANSSGQGRLTDDAESWLRNRSDEIVLDRKPIDIGTIKASDGSTTGPTPTSWSGTITRDASLASSTYAMRFGMSSIWKIGHAQDVPSRLDEINRHIPFEALGQKWTLVFQQGWAGSRLAYQMEQAVLQLLNDRRTEGERVRCSKDELENVWANAFAAVRLQPR